MSWVRVLGFMLLFVGAVGFVLIRFENPALTETQLLIRGWRQFVATVAGASLVVLDMRLRSR